MRSREVIKLVVPVLMAKAFLHDVLNARYVLVPWINILIWSHQNPLPINRESCRHFPCIFFTESFSVFNKISLMCVPDDPFDNKLSFAQVMARCSQAASHYLNQCWKITMTWWSHNVLSRCCISVFKMWNSRFNEILFSEVWNTFIPT